MKTTERTDYAVVTFTNPYHGSRHSGFKRYSDTRWVRIDEQGLTLREAQKLLLNYFCQDAGRYIPNWGVAVRMKFYNQALEASPTRSDGTRCYEEDVYLHEIISMSELDPETIRVKL